MERSEVKTDSSRRGGLEVGGLSGRSVKVQVDCCLTLVRAESALRTMVVALPVATPPLLEIGAMNRTKLTELCQRHEH